MRRCGRGVGQIYNFFASARNVCLFIVRLCMMWPVLCESVRFDDTWRRVFCGHLCEGGGKDRENGHSASISCMAGSTSCQPLCADRKPAEAASYRVTAFQVHSSSPSSNRSSPLSCLEGRWCRASRPPFPSSKRSLLSFQCNPAQLSRRRRPSFHVSLV